MRIGEQLAAKHLLGQLKLTLTQWHEWQQPTESSVSFCRLPDDPTIVHQSHRFLGRRIILAPCRHTPERASGSKQEHPKTGQTQKIQQLIAVVFKPGRVMPSIPQNFVERSARTEAQQIRT